MGIRLRCRYCPMEWLLDVVCTSLVLFQTFVFQDMQHFHKKQLRKLPEEMTFEDDGPLAEEYPNYQAIILDKGYQDSKEFIRAMHPSKKPKMEC